MYELKIAEVEKSLDWLTFTSSVISSLAWPSVALGIAFLFRKQLRKLIDRIKRLSVGDNSVDFSDKLDEAEAEVVRVAPQIPPGLVEETPAIDQRTQQLIALSPAAAVLDSWRGIERKVRNLVSLVAPKAISSLEAKRMFTVRRAAGDLLEQGFITKTTYAILLDLQHLRNVAAHDGDVSAADALRFNQLATDVLRLLDGADVRPDNADSTT